MEEQLDRTRLDRFEPGSAPLRVLHVINKISPSGGAEVSLRQLLPPLADLGLVQGLVTLLPSTAPDALAEFAEHGIKFWSTGASDLPRAVLGIRRAVQEFRPDLIASTLYEANRAARITGAVAGVPVLCGVVNTPYGVQARAAAPSPWKLSVVAQLERILARHLTSGFHALTDAAASDAVDRLGIDPARMTVIPRGRLRAQLRDKDEWTSHRAAVRRSLGVPEDAVVILNVARQERQKGQVHLVEAFEAVAASYLSAVLLIAGRAGAATPALLRRVEASPVRERIHLLGLRTDVPDLLHAADVFAFSSLWEGLGGAVLEALGAGVPVAAFDVPAVAEVLGDAGRTVPIGDADALAAVLLDLVADSGLRADLAERGRRRFAERFDLDVVVPKMAAMYRQAAARPAPGRRTHH